MRTAALLTTLSLLAGAGCSEGLGVRRSVVLPAALGTVADVKTSAGTHATHEVVGGCEEEHAILGVRPRGRRRVALAPHQGWDDEMIALRDAAERVLGELALSVSWGQACRGEQVAMRVLVGSFVQVDDAVARVGAFLAARDRADEAVVLVLPRRRGEFERHIEIYRYTPRARPPFWPYELALAAGARHEDGWDTSYGLHLGYIWGRARGSSLDGAFFGPGLDLRVVDGEWTAGPVARVGWAFGVLYKQWAWPSEGTNRGTYLYLQAGLALGDERLATGSLGFTTFAPHQAIIAGHTLRPWQRVLLSPFFFVNHLELEFDQYGRVAVLAGFSL